MTTPPADGGRHARRRGPSRGDRREAAILDGAWALLASRPLADITVDDLASAAGLSRSAFYFYFPSKDAVVAALAARVGAELADVVDGLAGGRDATEAGLRAGLAAYLERWKQQGGVLRAMDALAGADPDLRAFWRTVTDDLLARIAAGIDDLRDAGLAAPAPPAAIDLAHVLLSMVWRTMWELSADPLPRRAEQRRLDALVVACVRTVVGPGA